MASFMQRHMPTTLSGVVGNPTPILKLKQVVKKQKPILLHGPTGVGKTLAVKLLAKEMGYELVEIDGDNFHPAAFETSGLFGKKMILVDNIESFKFNAAFMNTLKKTKNPVIFIAIDLWDSKLRNLRYICEIVEFRRISEPTITKYLVNLLEKEEKEYELEAIKIIAKNADGDLRAAIMDLDVLCADSENITVKHLEMFGERLKTEKIFAALNKIFRGSNIMEAMSAFDNLNLSLETSGLWVAENIPHAFKSGEEIAGAYNLVSKGDVFFGRIIKQQYWRFLVYANALNTAGVASIRKQPTSFFAYKRPGKLLKLYQSKSKRLLLKSIANKIAQKTHTSSRVAKQSYVPMFRVLLKQNPKLKKEYTDLFELDKAELSFLTS